MRRLAFIIAACIPIFASAAPALAVGTVLLANDGQYYSASGPSWRWHTDWSEGFCGRVASWCSPKQFRWTYKTQGFDYDAQNRAVWRNPYPVSAFSRVYAFIPRRDATATIEYAVRYDSASYARTTVAQTLYYDQWVPITPSSSLVRFVNEIELDDASFYGSTANKVAFDEIKIEN